MLLDARIAERAEAVVAALTPNLGTSVDALERERARVLLRLADACEAASWFSAGDVTRTRPKRLLQMSRIARRLVELGSDRKRLTSSVARHAGQLRQDVEYDIGHMAGAEEEDGIQLIFGISTNRLIDARGVVSGDRVHTYFADRPNELKRIGRTIGHGLSDARAVPVDSAWFPTAIALTNHPLVCREIARATVDAISHASLADLEGAASVIVDLLYRIPEAASSHFDGTVAISRRLGQQPPAGETARLKLDRFRSVIEGQLRHTGWAFLRLRGRGSPGSVPMVGHLRRLLEKEETDEGFWMAQGMRETWRNASAHEDAYWDVSDAVLRLEGQAVDLDALDDTVDRALAVVAGFEVGVKLARSVIPEFAAAIDRRAPPPPQPLLDLALRRVFAGQGLFVWDTRWAKDAVEVVLDSPPAPDNVAAILMAVLRAGTEFHMRRDCLVSGRGHDVRLRTTELGLLGSEQLLPRTRSAIPSDVLLPLLGEAQCAAGLAPASAARQVAKVALQDPLSLARRTMTQVIQRDRPMGWRLARSMSRCARALETTWIVIGHNGDLGSLPDALRSTARAVRGWARSGIGYDELAARMNGLIELESRLPRFRLDPRE